MPAKRSTSLLIFVTFANLLPFSHIAEAHETGLTFESIVGEYSMDIGFDTYAAIAGQEIFMEFSLMTPMNESEATFAPYTDVEVTFVHDKKTIDDVRLPPSDFKGRRFLNYTFPKGGVYEMTVKFFEKNRLLAGKTFSLSVQNNPDASVFPWLQTSIVGAFFTFGIGFYAYKRLLNCDHVHKIV